MQSPRSGSTPVVSQSIISPMVPVGAKTLAWLLRTPDGLGEFGGLVPATTGLAHQIGRHVLFVDLRRGGLVLTEHPQHVLAVLGESGERPHP